MRCVTFYLHDVRSRQRKQRQGPCYIINYPRVEISAQKPSFHWCVLGKHRPTSWNRRNIA